MSAADYTADLIVIGGGIHGCSAALHAALRGMSVIVLEKDTVGRHASAVNAGGMRRLGRHFAEVPISERSMEMWYGIADFLEDDCGFQIAPQIKVAETEAELAQLIAHRDELNKMGFTHEILLDRAGVRAYLPAVADHVVGGLACLDDGFAQPIRRYSPFSAKRNLWACVSLSMPALGRCEKRAAIGRSIPARCGSPHSAC